MRPIGGLKLALQGARRDDRRVRFANVFLAAADAEHNVTLVTDSQGRMRHPLPEGDYVLRTEEGREARFAVRGRRWTTVRVRLQ